MGTKADDDERKRQRLAALQAREDAEAAKRGAGAGGSAAGPSAGPSAGPPSSSSRGGQSQSRGGGDLSATAEAMRRQILAEREKRRAARAASEAEAASRIAAEDADPRHAPLVAAIARLEAASAAPSDESVSGLLLRLATNAAKTPPDPRFARVRLSNPKIRAACVDRAEGAGSAVLMAAGFEPEEGPDGSDELVLPPDRAASEEGRASLRVAIRRLRALAPATAALLDAPKPPERRDPRAVPAGGRDARVFLPAEACAAFSAELPEDFFARDAAEVQRDFELAKQRRERDSVLSTRAWKKGAAAAGGGGGGASAEQASEEARLRELSRPATIRVRMPDGELLQGSFGRREPVGALRAFVAECVKDPFRKFTLAFLNAPLDEEDRGGGSSSAAGARGGGHDARRAAELRRDGSALRGANRPNVGDGSFGEGYAAHGTLEGAGLVPAALVTFAWAEPPAPGGISERQTSGGALKDELMRAAVPLE